MSYKEYIKSQKDCAKLLGMTLKEYNESLKNIKKVSFSNVSSSKNKDVILEKLGITKSDLKIRA